MVPYDSIIDDIISKQPLKLLPPSPPKKKKKIILENERQMFDLAHSPGTEKRNYKCFALIIREQRHQQN